MKKQECKRHDWKVGSYIGGFKNKRIIKEGINIWCFKCGKKIKAYYIK